jgi:hypothetical protein
MGKNHVQGEGLTEGAHFRFDVVAGQTSLGGAFFFFVIGDWTQGLELAGQVLSTEPQPRCF